MHVTLVNVMLVQRPLCKQEQVHLKPTCFNEKHHGYVQGKLLFKTSNTTSTDINGISIFQTRCSSDEAHFKSNGFPPGEILFLNVSARLELHFLSLT